MLIDIVIDNLGNVWHKGFPENDGEYIVQIEGATKATCLEYVSKYHAWFDENDNDYAVAWWMPLPEPPEVEYETD